MMKQANTTPTAGAVVTRPVVVGIGASAGGLEAIVQLLSQSPPQADLSYVIIQHLSPDHQSALAEILSKRLDLPIHQVSETTKILPNHVYVIPPGKYLAIKDYELKLSEPPDARGSRMAIDYFMRSLAEDACEFGIGVLLSGTGSDGSAGLKEIKHYGGLTVVQDPDEASHRGMPQSAINAGAVDLVLPVADIAVRLCQYVEHARAHGPLSAQAIAAMEQVDISPVLSLLKREASHDFRSYRKATLTRRISRRMGLQGMEQVQDYVALLNDNREELLALKYDLLIGVTRFFRDAPAWEMLQEKVIKPLVDRSNPGKPLRIWCAGCATGEEAYSLAMLFQEQAVLSDKPVSFQIFASDVALEALDFAREGHYSDAIVADVSVERLRRFFQKVENGYRVSKQLRENVVFAEQNVLAQAPFSKLDLISCRNLLIYLQREAQQGVFSVFQFALKENGFLFLGSSESIEQPGDLFELVNAKYRIHRRSSVKSLPPVRSTNREEQSPEEAPGGDAFANQANYRPSSRIGHLVHRQLIKEMEQGIAVVNAENRVLYLEGRADLYLQLTMGELTAETPDIYSLAREGVKSRLRTLIRRAQQSSDPVEETCRVKREGMARPCRIRIRKLNANIGEDRPLLITFDTIQSDSRPAGVESSSGAELPSDVTELQHELLTTREQLSTTIAELETANEELKASNEEAMTMNEQLQSGNEELETSKEELQSLNEELTTLNNQLELKLDELQHTTDDLNNLLTSASVPTIFLDTNLRIRRFTPTCRGLYNFIPTDIGRPLADIVRLHDDANLIEDARQTLRTLVPLSKEVVCEDNRCFIRRILPYRTEDDRIQGVVLTFAEVTELAAAKREASRNLAELKSIYHAAPIGLAFTTRDLDYVSINDELAAINGFPAEEHIGKNLRDILPETLADEVVQFYQHIIDTGEPITGVEIRGRTAASESERTWQASYAAVKDEHDEIIGVNTVVQDVTEQRAYQRALADSRERLEIALSAGKMGTWYWDLATDRVEWSDQMYALLGVNKDEFTPRKNSFIKRVHPDDRNEAKRSIEESLANSDTEHRHECRVVRDNDRKIAWVERRGVIRRDKDGNPVSMTGVTIDVTDRHRHEESLQQAKDAAEAANRSRGEFLANMSHEIRTPMTAILGYADMLSAHLQNPDNLQCVETIRRNGRFLLEIIDDILDLSKIDAGKFEVAVEQVSPENIIADIVSLMNVRAAEKHVELEVEFDGTLPRLIRTDSKRLRQILLNLVGNAIKFTNEGRVRLITRFNHRDRNLELAVEDTGIGVDAKKVAMLFEPFSQGDGSITRNFGGTGLGLAISARLAEILGGEISVESDVGAGSTFTLTIDPGEVSDVEFIQPSLTTSTAATDDPDLHVSGEYLIVDDRRDIRFLAQQFIEAAGGTTRTASDGQEGIDSVQAAIEEGRPFDAVCMDMQMPILDGYAATRELRRRGIDVPIIALTAHAMHGDEEACLEAGCSAFISKPIDKVALLSTLARVSRRSHSELVRKQTNR